MASSDYLGFSQLGQKYIPSGMDIAKNQEDLQMSMLDRKVKQLLHEDNQYKYDRKRKFNEETDALASSMKEERKKGTKEGSMESGFELSRWIDRRVAVLTMQYPEYGTQLQGISKAMQQVKDADKEAFHKQMMDSFYKSVEEAKAKGPVSSQQMQEMLITSQALGIEGIENTLKNMTSARTNDVYVIQDYMSAAGYSQEEIDKVVAARIGAETSKARGSSSDKWTAPTAARIKQVASNTTTLLDNWGFEVNKEGQTEAVATRVNELVGPYMRDHPDASEMEITQKALEYMMTVEGSLTTKGGFNYPTMDEWKKKGGTFENNDLVYNNQAVIEARRVAEMNKRNQAEMPPGAPGAPQGPQATPPVPQAPPAAGPAPRAPQGVPDPYGNAFTNGPPQGPAQGPDMSGGPSEMLPSALDPNFQVMQGGRPGWSGNVLDPTGGRDQSMPPPIPADRPQGMPVRTAPARPPAAPMVATPIESQVNTEGLRELGLEPLPAQPTKKPELTKSVETKLSREASKTAVDIIKNFESFVGRVYDDAYDQRNQKDVNLPFDQYTGTPTIGYGSTTGLRPGQTITEEEASERLQRKVNVEMRKVDRDFPGLLPHQKAVLVSLIFNTGYSAWKKSRAFKALSKGDYDTFAYEAFDPEVGFVKTRQKGKLVISKGLQNRRAKEKAIFFGV